jgi:hypothetical protein
MGHGPDQTPTPPRLERKLGHHPDNLHALYRESEDPVERSRWHAIWLRFGAPAPQMNRATGHSIPKVAQTLGYSTLAPPELQEAFQQALL